MFGTDRLARMDVAITGSHGLIGTALIDALTKAGHKPIRLVRGAAATGEVAWDPTAGKLDANALNGVDAVINLAGAGIGDHRWTPAYKAELVESRTKGTTLLATTIASLDRKPAVFLSGSAIGFYGNSDQPLDETATAGTGFLPDLCVAWEAAAQPAADAGIRTALLRTGIVLSAKGGALKKQLPLFKIGVGGRMGSGKQWQSFISINDHIAAVLHLLQSSIAGPVNLTAPNPVTNSEFTKALARAIHRPAVFPIPSFGPKLLLGGELAQNLLFDGQRVLPTKLIADGFAFAHPTIGEALTAALAR
jgi:uncharacterized protein (TIGR01777 family)